MDSLSHMDHWVNVSIPPAHHAMVTAQGVYLADPKKCGCVKQWLELWVTPSVLSDTSLTVAPITSVQLAFVAIADGGHGGHVGCCLDFVLSLVYIISLSACLSEPLEQNPALLCVSYSAMGHGSDCRFQLQMQRVFVS